jgi:hypothetical protein
MNQTEHRGWMWQFGLAFFKAFLVLGIGLPNTGRIVIDHTTTPPTTHIVGRSHDSLILIGAVAVPLVLILAGIFRRSWLAVPGWILLAVLLVMAFMK